MTAYLTSIGKTPTDLQGSPSPSDPTRERGPDDGDRPRRRGPPRRRRRCGRRLQRQADRRVDRCRVPDLVVTSETIGDKQVTKGDFGAGRPSAAGGTSATAVLLRRRNERPDARHSCAGRPAETVRIARPRLLAATGVGRSSQIDHCAGIAGGVTELTRNGRVTRLADEAGRGVAP